MGGYLLVVLACIFYAFGFYGIAQYVDFSFYQLWLTISNGMLLSSLIAYSIPTLGLAIPLHIIGIKKIRKQNTND